MATLATRPRRRHTVEEKDLGDEYMFYDAQGEKVHVLNGIAREIYLLCDGEHSVADLVKDIVDRYEVDEETASKDVDALLQQLTELELLSLP